jgi:hypothetical protein
MLMVIQDVYNRVVCGMLEHYIMSKHFVVDIFCWLRASTMGHLTRGAKEKILAVLPVTTEVPGIVLASMIV